MNPVLALDLSQNTGWAFWRPGMDSPRYGLIRLPRNLDEGELYRERLSLRRWMRDWDALESLKHGYVVIEAAWVRFGDREPKDEEARRRDSLWQVEHLWGLATEAATTAAELKATPRNTKHATMMKAWTGKGDYTREKGKEASINSANAMGWETTDDNVADALGLLFHFTQFHRLEVPWNVAGPLFGGNKVRAIG